jgi:phospholipid transport system transporter-binding protein
MTFDTVRELLLQSKALFAPGSDLKLHLSEVQHADSAGLALLLEWIAQARKAGGSVAVDGMPDALKTIARLCRMEDELDSFVGPKR